MESTLRFSRRTFVAWVGGASAGFYLFGRLPGLSPPVALAQIEGGTLDPLSVPKFQTALLIPPVMPRAETIVRRGTTIDYYEISMKQFSQQILPAGLPATAVWGYGAVASANKKGLLIHHAPSLTIETMWNRPVRIKWINELVDESGGYLPHLLPVDPDLHLAVERVRGVDLHPLRDAVAPARGELEQLAVALPIVELVATAVAAALMVEVEAGRAIGTPGLPCRPPGPVHRPAPAGGRAAREPRELAATRTSLLGPVEARAEQDGVIEIILVRRRS